MFDRKEYMEKYHKKHYLKNKEEYKKRSKEYREKNKDDSSYQEMMLKSRLKHRYNLSLENYNALLIKQNYKCAICKEEVKLSVDHNHKTGEVRGLLCTLCNQAIGMFKENVTNLSNATNYLKGDLKWNN